MYEFPESVDSIPDTFKQLYSQIDSVRNTQHSFVALSMFNDIPNKTQYIPCQEYWQLDDLLKMFPNFNKWDFNTTNLKKILTQYIPKEIKFKSDGLLERHSYRINTYKTDPNGLSISRYLAWAIIKYIGTPANSETRKKTYDTTFYQAYFLTPDPSIEEAYDNFIRIFDRKAKLLELESTKGQIANVFKDHVLKFNYGKFYGIMYANLFGGQKTYEKLKETYNPVQPHMNYYLLCEYIKTLQRILENYKKLNMDQLGQESFNDYSWAAKQMRNTRHNDKIFPHKDDKPENNMRHDTPDETLTAFENNFIKTELFKHFR